MYEMAGLHFYLEKRNVKNEGVISIRECPVILSFSYSSLRVKTYTGRKVKEEEWDKTKERIKTIYAHAEKFNSYLDQLEERVNAYYIDMQSSSRIEDPVILQKELRRMVKSDSLSFFGLLLVFIEQGNQQWSSSTYKKMKTFYSQLKEFSLESEKEIIPGMINQAFADNLVYFYRKKGLKDTSIRKNLDLLKWSMNWGLKKGLIFNRDYQLIQFSPEKTKILNEEIFLRWEELIALYEVGGLSKKQEWSRDIFCFIAFTGIRFTEITKLRKESLNGRFILKGEVSTQKILLNRFSMEICRKYENKYYRNNTFLPVLSLITFHKHLQSAGLISGLNRSVYKIGNDSKPCHLHQLLSSRTAINTYFANALKLDNTLMLTTAVKANSSKSRIMALSGGLKLAEEKQIQTSDKLYESIRSAGPGPK